MNPPRSKLKNSATNVNTVFLVLLLRYCLIEYQVESYRVFSPCLLIEQLVFRLLHVVRDPRASINSRIKLGWFPEFNHTKFTKVVENYCNVIIDNIEFGQNLDDSVKHRYKLVFYRDIAANPLNTAKEIFTFAGMDLDENTFEWIKATTNLSNKTEANKANFKSLDSLVRNSKANIEKWRIESPPERTNAIEKICKPLLELIDEMSMSENVHWITE